jgi:hypothetical protein
MSAANSPNNHPMHKHRAVMKKLHALQTNPNPSRLILRLLGVAALGLFALIVAPAAHAEPPGPGPGPRPGKPPGGLGHDGDESMRREVVDHMRAMRMWKLTEELRLDEKQAAQFFPVLNRFDERERDLAKQQAEVVKAMRAELDAPANNPNKAQLGKLVDTLLANRAKKYALDEERAKSLRKLLDPVQQARLVLLLPRMDDAFRRHMRRALEGDRPERPGDGRHDEHRRDRRPGPDARERGF